jgi:hypothetical protein
METWPTDPAHFTLFGACGGSNQIAQAALDGAITAAEPLGNWRVMSENMAIERVGVFRQGMTSSGSGGQAGTYVPWASSGGVATMPTQGSTTAARPSSRMSSPTSASGPSGSASTGIAMESCPTPASASEPR